MTALPPPTNSPSTSRSLKLRLSTALAALWVTAPAAWALASAVFVCREYWPVDGAPAPVFISTWGLRAQLIAALAVAIIALIIGLASTAMHLIATDEHDLYALRIAKLALLPITYSMSATYCLIPWESPYDGAGSPLAGLIGLIMLTIACTIFVAPVALTLLSRKL